MIQQYNRVRARRRLVIIALFGLAVFAAIALYNSAIAVDQALVLSLYHDANHDGQRQPSEVPAGNYAYMLAWTDGTQATSATGMTDAEGMIFTSVYTGTWTLTGDALHWQMVVDGEVLGSGVQEVAVGRYGLWLAQVRR